MESRPTSTLTSCSTHRRRPRSASSTATVRGDADAAYRARAQHIRAYANFVDIFFSNSAHAMELVTIANVVRTRGARSRNERVS
jgi:hypothetical protein